MTTEWERDAALLDAWRDGDGQAGEQLFDLHADAVARFFENKIREGAEDLTQATFLRLIEGQARIREGIAFRAFLLGIARNVFREHLRALARGRKIDPEVESMAELAPGPTTVASNKQEQRLLLEALRRLPVDVQMILELHYWEELKTDDIASIMDQVPSTMRGNLVKARKRLRAVMAEIAASPELLSSTLEGLDGWAAELRELLGEHLGNHLGDPLTT
ncbi:RNA polymerase sigma factor [Enhygromyxa salina]|uniref:RNA polymerase sigma factor CarQ n=1 Tax=Enhygromyxa salina TaxID=215803 RepID=A0A2S9YIJ4_9BACT|nr:sigma-70 family RNA polymerase sigma factor [Enhygromyxa salina]PRQ04881.1 RNA polymerase sigma factor CarQ [Enhygromyxa salina]